MVESQVKLLILFVAWCTLLVLSWPIALVVLVVAPLIWLVSLPFLLLGVCVSAIFALLKSLMFLPARILGHRG
jgi:hypothetical protein